MVGNPWPGPLVELLDPPFDERTLDELSQHIVAQHRSGEPRAPRRRRPKFFVAAFASSLVVAALIWFVVALVGPREEISEPGAVRLANGEALTVLVHPADEGTPLRVDLDDGSSLDLAPGSVLLPVENNRRRHCLELRRGRVALEIRPGSESRWVVDAGHASVEVVGTIFTVSRDDEVVTVSVARGEVRVKSDHLEGGEIILSIGETIEIRVASLPSQEDVAGYGQPLTDAGLETAFDAEIAHLGATTGWREHVGRGDYRLAYEELGPEGVERELEEADTMADLLILADVARLSGHPAEAVAPLERAVREFADDRRAPVAAFTLGRIEASLGQQGRAGRAFRLCLELDPPRALRDDVYSRLAESYARAGRYDELRGLAREYHRRYPDGRLSEELRRWVSQP